MRPKKEKKETSGIRGFIFHSNPMRWKEWKVAMPLYLST